MALTTPSALTYDVQRLFLETSAIDQEDSRIKKIDIEHAALLALCAFWSTRSELVCSHSQSLVSVVEHQCSLSCKQKALIDVVMEGCESHRLWLHDVEGFERTADAAWIQRLENMWMACPALRKSAHASRILHFDEQYYRYLVMLPGLLIYSAASYGAVSHTMGPNAVSLKSHR